MIWFGKRRGYLSDWTTQMWVRATGRRVDLQESPWLAGPRGGTRCIGADFFEEYARSSGRELVSSGAPRGLVRDLSEVTAGAHVDPKVADFYEQTSEYEMDCWSEWSAPFRPIGRLLAVLFSRRLEQLNVPLSGLDTSRGITSRVLLLRGSEGEVETAWVRELSALGRIIYAGSYSVCRLPGLPGPCVKVVFPLPNGRAIVFMRAEVQADGSLRLLSDGRGFGDPGFYFVVEGNGRAWARYVASMNETIHVYAAEGESVRTDHVLRIWGRTFLRLHYRLWRPPQERI